MKKRKWKWLANTLIVLGALLVVIGGADILANYPWQLLKAQLGMEIETDLPDPVPLKTAYTFYDPEEPAEGAPVESLPADNNGLSIGRPRMSLTLIGNLKIPKLGITENLVEGTEDEMMYGVGHLVGSAYPGQKGNCVIAGHRNYIRMHPFRYLTELKEGDLVKVSANGIEYTYEIYKTFSVDPTETWVVQPQDGEEAIVTLITCTPIPTYTQRLICWGRLVTETESVE